MNTQRAAIKAGAARAAGETWEDVLDYYTFNADRGEVDFAYRLGKIFYHGSIYASPGGIASGSEGVSAVPRDIGRARYYFLNIAREVWPRDPVNPAQYTPSASKEESNQVGRGYASASAGFLGRMALRGEGVKQDFGVAKMWFERGAEYGDRESHNGLGIIYRNGLLGKPDMKKAVAHFKVAAAQDLAEAEVNLGKYHYGRGELTLATTYFESAIRHGSPFEAYYYLGAIYSAQAQSSNVAEHYSASACAMAVSFYKTVAEKGVWDDDLLRDAEAAWVEGTDRGKEVAMLKWWIAAERGFEIAQSNLAFILDQDKSILRLTRFSPIQHSNETARLALTQWTRAAAQRNIDALVKVGDYYYHGLGVSEEDKEEARFEKAARYYQSAVDTQVSALAMWNLGWMYENGVGVPQDFHLAKRHYDGALETNAEAYIPILISLGKLYIKSIWHTLNGGENGLSIWEVEDPRT
jgi:SEL1 protein